MRLRAKAKTRTERMVAVLHDVVEDSDWTIDKLRAEGFDESVLRALECLTKRTGETYDEFIERVARNRLATRIKLLDLQDNSDLSRIQNPTDKDRRRIDKYTRALARLRAEPSKRSLWVRLDDPSREALTALAAYPIVRATHVTLAHRVDPDTLQPTWIPGAHSVGQRLPLRAIAVFEGPTIQAVKVTIGDSAARPFDGKTLHVTVSRKPEARSFESNRLFDSFGEPTQDTHQTPLQMDLTGSVVWVD